MKKLFFVTFVALGLVLGFTQPMETALLFEITPQGLPHIHG